MKKNDDYHGTQSLPGYLIESIRSLLSDIVPDAVFEYDEASMMNVKADDILRSKTFVYVEEITTSRIERIGFSHFRTTPCYIYFCRFEPFQNDAYHGDTRHSQQAASQGTIPRQTLRDQLEDTIVLPFIAAVGHKFRRHDTTPRYTLDYPPPRFDANEVSVLLTINLTQYICLENWKKPSIPST